MQLGFWPGFNLALTAPLGLILLETSSSGALLCSGSLIVCGPLCFMARLAPYQEEAEARVRALIPLFPFRIYHEL